MMENDSENRAGEAGGGSREGAGLSAANSGPAGTGGSETAEQRAAETIRQAAREDQFVATREQILEVRVVLTHLHGILKTKGGRGARREAAGPRTALHGSFTW